MDSLADAVSKVAKRSSNWAMKKLEKLFDYSLLADAVGLSSPFLEEKIRLQIHTIQDIEASMAKFVTSMRKLIAADTFPEDARKNIELLDAMPGVGFTSAITLLAETGDFSKFPSAKALSAFFWC